MIEAVVFLHKLEAEEDERMALHCEEIIKKYLNTHPDGKASLPFETQDDFSAYMEYIAARNELEKIDQKKKKCALEDALAAIEKDALEDPDSADEDDDASDSNPEEESLSVSF